MTVLRAAVLLDSGFIWYFKLEWEKKRIMYWERQSERVERKEEFGRVVNMAWIHRLSQFIIYLLTQSTFTEHPYVPDTMLNAEYV